MKIAFWNTNKNTNINEVIRDIIRENKINIMVLAEYKDNIECLIDMLNVFGLGMRKYLTIGCDRIVMLGNMEKMDQGNQGKHYTMQIINDDFVFCAMHLPSNIYGNSQEKRNIVIDSIVNDINELEFERNTDKTIIIGDLNENPYSPGCIEASKFHGIPSGDDSSRVTRTISGKAFKMFYNPMWNLLGDFQFPPGTYYYDGSTTNNSFWHIFDQVMIRPSLREQFVEEQLKILTATNTISLLDENKHPNKEISDHLPIVFEIKEL